MTAAEFLAKTDKSFRKIAINISPLFYIAIYSYGRKLFLKRFSQEIPASYRAPGKYRKKIWDIEFSSPIFNAAGMFKKGEGYRTVAEQGAGAYLAGTTTSVPRTGNMKKAILHPFVPLTNSNAAINWMGLPNEGNEQVAKRISKIEKIEGCPVGASVAASPELKEKDALLGVVEGIKLYEKANVDFIELNESCPNIEHYRIEKNSSSIDINLLNRLEFISHNFLKRRNRNLPVIVKFSLDTDEKIVPSLIDVLIELGFDGINLGNTSVNYDYYFEYIKNNEKGIFNYFTKNFGGGISGKPLKEKSLCICSTASEYLQSKSFKKEFNIIRTGGLDSFEDILRSQDKGISLNQWFTGYFENFSKYGHKVYKELFT